MSLPRRPLFGPSALSMHNLERELSHTPPAGHLGGSLHAPPAGHLWALSMYGGWGGRLSTHHLGRSLHEPPVGHLRALSTYHLEGLSPRTLWGDPLHIPPVGSLHVPPGWGVYLRTTWGGSLHPPPGGAPSMHHLGGCLHAPSARYLGASSHLPRGASLHTPPGGPSPHTICRAPGGLSSHTTSRRDSLHIPPEGHLGALSMHLLGEPSLYTTRGDFSTHYLRDTWGGLLMYQLGGFSPHTICRGTWEALSMHHREAGVGMSPCTT